MNNLNSVLIEGNLVKDVQTRSTTKGTNVCTFPIATNRYYRQETGMEKEVSFFNVEAWGKLAESAERQGNKGRGIRVVGRLKQDRWTGTDGKPQSKIVIVAEHIEFRYEPRKDAPCTDETVETENAECVESLIPNF